MELFLSGILNESSSSNNSFSHLDIQKCPFLRNINEPTNFSFSSARVSNPARGTKGPIFEDEPNFDLAFKLFHGRDGVVPLSGKSFTFDEAAKLEPAPQFNPLAGKAASIGLSAFGPGGPFSFDFFNNKKKKLNKKSSKQDPFSKKGGNSSSHEALSNEWLETGQCPIAKSYRAVSHVLPLVAKTLQPPSGIKLRCPPAVVAARAALARTAFVKSLRPQPLPAKMLAIATLGMAANVPLGIWREHTKNQAVIMGGVITERCYGCGRCFPVCPYDKIRAMTYVRDPAATSELLKRDNVDAIEVHTSGRHTDLFSELWDSLSNSIGHVKLVAVSLPDLGESTVPVMNILYSIMEANLRSYNLWQLDGRPMSGDIGRGATRETIAFAVRLASQQQKPHGFYQLAGGTNAYTLDSLKSMGIFKAKTFPENLWDHGIVATSACSQKALIGGIAYGGYARKIVGRVLRRMAMQHGHAHIEEYPEFLWEALREALALVWPVKSYDLASF